MNQDEKSAVVKEVTNTWQKVVQAKVDAVAVERKALPDSAYWKGQDDCIRGVMDALFELSVRQASQPVK